MHERAIVDEIIRRVSERLAAAIEQDQSERPRLLLLAREPSDLLSEFCHSEQLAAKWQVECVFPANLEGLEFDELPSADTVLVFDLTIEDLTLVSSIMLGSGYASTIIKAIMSGSKVYIDEKGMGLSAWEDKCPYSYHNLLCSKVRFLEKCDVVFSCFDADSMFKLLLDGTQDIVSPTKTPFAVSKPAYIWDRRVLTEQDLVRLLSEGNKVVALSGRTILTDLAREYIKRHNIELLYEE